jgi:hypothetical protein
VEKRTARAFSVFSTDRFCIENANGFRQLAQLHLAARKHYTNGSLM